ncbi:Trk system potassium uptake protein trkA [Gemella morbillorum]|uniref:Trk system potassium uptake protein TrkA n=2 Tax=Gemella morbillorum TaxID=29391 RepID=A0A2X4NGE5_9BACL|nr:Trk system potassium transporter TrkA [Gemella morbillorum]EFV35929.1 TrkA-N domain-containing protein [Gemella morbillorum M424]QGS09587.1 Trk system potassium transporter TrkA [Gemella morbillorum]UBH81487.1 Trk system potassium transporter TrkA [Gemella morbillorum]SQH55257.1 Trk system potassium uptake protein trkA [Gemella morbillorum]
MKVVIVGGGKVGELLCADFSNIFKEVTIIDTNELRVEKLVETYDINGILGNGANYEVLTRADSAEADMFISVTASDEINMICCIAAKQMGAKYTIARIRNPEYSKTKEFLRESLGIDLMVNPEYEAAKQISHMLKYPTAIKVESFFGGKFNILEVIINSNSILNGVSLIDSKKIIDFPSLVCLVERQGEVFVPRGNYVFNVGDKVHITAANKNLKKFYKLLGNQDNMEKKITSSLVIGGGKIAYYLVEFLQIANFYVKVIEIDKNKAIALSETFPDIDVIWADGSDRDTLIEEGIQTFDSCISLTGFDEENIIINLYADKLGIKKTVAKVNRASLKQIAEDIGQYSYITPKEIVGNIITKYTKSLQCSKHSDIENFYRIANNQAEVIEFKITNNSAKILGIKLKDLAINPNMLIAFIIRNNKQIFPNGDDEIKLDDNVVVVSYKHKIEHIDDIISRGQ